MRLMKLSTALSAVLLLAAFTSCMTTKFIMDPDLSPEPKKTLLSGLSIIIESDDDDKSLIGAAANMFEARELDDFGMQAEQALVDYLGTKGFDLFKDKDMAKRSDLAINLGEKASLLGYWVHPETSAYQTNYFTGPTLGFNKQEYIQKVKGDSNIEYFLYSDLRIYKSYSLWIFGGFPQVVFRVAVVNSEGKVVVEAQAIGKGKKQFIGINMEKENLSTALSNAIVSLEELK